MPGETFSWVDDIRQAGENSRKRDSILNARLDKIIRELEATDHAWYLKYARGNEISFMLLSCDVTEQGKSLKVLGIKRAIIQYDVIPAMYACIRAGFVVPADEVKE